MLICCSLNAESCELQELHVERILNNGNKRSHLHGRLESREGPCAETCQEEELAL